MEERREDVIPVTHGQAFGDVHGEVGCADDKGNRVATEMDALVLPSRKQTGDPATVRCQGVGRRKSEVVMQKRIADKAQVTMAVDKPFYAGIMPVWALRGKSRVAQGSRTIGAEKFDPLCVSPSGRRSLLLLDVPVRFAKGVLLRKRESCRPACRAHSSGGRTQRTIEIGDVEGVATVGIEPTKALGEPDGLANRCVCHSTTSPCKPRLQLNTEAGEVHTACVLALAVGRSIPGNGWDGPQAGYRDALRQSLIARRYSSSHARDFNRVTKRWNFWKKRHKMRRCDASIKRCGGS
jgi:hypothetical protein